MKKWLLVLVLLAMLVVPVIGTVLNTSVIYDGASTDNAEHTAYGTTAYLYTPPTNRAIVFQTLQLKGSGTTPFTYKLANGNSIVGSIVVTSTGLFSSTCAITINGGSTSTTSYIIGIPAQYAMILVDSSTQLYYFAISDRVERNSGFSIYKLNTATDAYIQLTPPPATNPIISTSITSSTPFDVITNSNSFTTLIYNQQVISAWTPGDPTATWGKILDGVYAIYLAITKFASGVLTFFILLQTGVLFLFMGQVLLTLIAAYTIINAILSIHDSDDLFKSISKFMRREMKLFKFFMEIFNWVKKMIVWW